MSALAIVLGFVALADGRVFTGCFLLYLGFGVLP